MELVDTNSESPTLISNVEVMQLLQKKLNDTEKLEPKKKKAAKKGNKHLRHKDWIEEEVHKYLQSTPCVLLDPDRREEFKAKLKGSKRSKQGTVARRAPDNKSNGVDGQQTATTTTGFGLTEAESLQIMNMMPSELVEIHLMVDDLQSRMSETRQEEFLAFIQSYNTSSDAAGESVPMEEEDDPGGNKNNMEVVENGNKNGKRPAIKVKKETGIEESESNGVT